MKPWLHIIGIGADGWDGLNAPARAALNAAGLVLGSERQTALLPAGMPRETWSGGLSGLLERLEQARRDGIATCLLASGDPMWHGIGASLIPHLNKGEYLILLSPSSFSLAAARLGWGLQNVTCLSLHNVAANSLLPHLAPRARLLLLSRNAETPAAVAALLRETGYRESRLHVLEHLGGERERVRAARAEGFALADIADLNLLAVEVAPHCAGERLGAFGLPDHAFHHDGNITRREIRVLALARLAPFPGARLWDVGAGSGSISVEWMRLHRRNRAVAIESREDRRRLIEKNRETFGVLNLEICAQAAPQAFAGLPPPDAIFVGGGLGAPEVLDASWAALPKGGRLVAHAVSLSGETALTRFRERHGGIMTRVAVERLEALGAQEGWRPARAITMLEAQR